MRWVGEIVAELPWVVVAPTSYSVATAEEGKPGPTNVG